MGVAWFFILFTLFCYIILNILWVKYFSNWEEPPQESEGDDAFFYSAMYLSQND
tara:strand:+ start:800 stop:961 length:162 start_codon:yes stop_codon:yes gene_type:complete